MVTNYVVGRIYDVTWTHNNTMFAGSGAHYIEFEPVNVDDFLDTIVYDVVNDVEYDIRAKNIIFSVTDNGNEFTIDVIDEDNTSHIFISDDVDVKFKNGKCIHNEFFNLTSDVLYIELLNGGIEHFCLYLYNFTGKQIELDKSSDLENSTLLNGQLNDICDILNPSILLDYDGVFEWNYCFVPKFKRWYFITKITSIRNGLWRIDLKVDVLFTYNDDIRKQDGFITRSESYHPSYLNDDRFPLKPELKTSISSISGGTLSNFSFDVLSSMYNVVIIAVNDLSTYQFKDITAPTGTSLPSIESDNVSNQAFYIYCMSGVQWKAVCDSLRTNNALTTYIAGVYLYPFNFGDKYFDASTDMVASINLGTSQVTAIAGKVQYDLLPYLVLADFVLPTPSSYLDLSPHSSYELYIPYYSGNYEIDISRLGGHHLIIYYSVQLSTANASVHVYDLTNNEILLTAPITLAQPLSYTTTNAYENALLRQQSNFYGISGTLEGVAKMIANAVMENPLGMLQAGYDITMTGVKWGFEQGKIRDKASITYATGGDCFMNLQSAYIIKKYKEPLFTSTYETIFREENGYPCNRSDNLSRQVGGNDVYTGYTEVVITEYKPNTLKFITITEISEIESLAKDGIIL